MKIIINGRFLTQKLSGVQMFALSYANQLFKIYEEKLIVLVPVKSKINENFNFLFRVKKIGSYKGHLWEQYDLPVYLKSINYPLLINLGNSAPIFYKNKFITIHDLSIYHNKKWHNIFYRSFYKFLTPLIIKNNQKIFTVSKFSKNEIMKKFKILDNNIRVVPNSLNININKINKNKSKEEYFLFVGSLNSRKNLTTLVESFKLLSNIKVKLKLVGVSKSEFVSQFGYQINVEPIGHVYGKELRKLYINSIALIFPSHYEGFGIPLIEAMLLGSPILCSDIEVFNEVCQDAAIYFNQNDKIQIKRKILDIYSNKYLISDLIKKGYSRINNFDIDKCVKIFQHEIDNIIS